MLIFEMLIGQVRAFEMNFKGGLARCRQETEKTAVTQLSATERCYLKRSGRGIVSMARIV